MKIRTATIEDAAAISQLVYSLSMKYIAIDFDDEGVRDLLASMWLQWKQPQLRVI